MTTASLLHPADAPLDDADQLPAVLEVPLSSMVQAEVTRTLTDPERVMVMALGADYANNQKALEALYPRTSVEAILRKPEHIAVIMRMKRPRVVDVVYERQLTVTVAETEQDLGDERLCTAGDVQALLEREVAPSVRTPRPTEYAKMPPVEVASALQGKGTWLSMPDGSTRYTRRSTTSTSSGQIPVAMPPMTSTEKHYARAVKLMS